MAESGSVEDRRAEDPRLVAMGKRIDGLVFDVQQNTVITKRIEESTSGLVEAWEALSGGLKVLNVLGEIAKWVTIVVTMVTAVWTAFYVATHGGSPSP